MSTSDLTLANDSSLDLFVPASSLVDNRYVRRQQRRVRWVREYSILNEWVSRRIRAIRILRIRPSAAPPVEALGDGYKAQNGYPSAPRIIGRELFKVSLGNVLPAFARVRPYCWLRDGLPTRKAQAKFDWQSRSYATWKRNSRKPWTRSRSLKLAQRAGSFGHAPGGRYKFRE